MAITAEGVAKRDQGFIQAAEKARTALAGTYPAEWNMLPRTRKEAQALGAVRFFNAKPCKQGHVSTKQTSKGVCEECHRLHRTSEAAHQTQRACYARNMVKPEFREANSRNSRKHWHEVAKHDQEKKARIYARNLAYQAANREESNRRRREFNARNPGYDRPYVVARRATIKHCDLTAQQQAQVKAIYRLRLTLSRATGVEYHVDHRIPLSKGGKHHPSNLWVIPAFDNLSKGAKLPAELAA